MGLSPNKIPDETVNQFRTYTTDTQQFQEDPILNFISQSPLPLPQHELRQLIIPETLSKKDIEHHQTMYLARKRWLGIHDPHHRPPISSPLRFSWNAESSHLRAGGDLVERTSSAAEGSGSMSNDVAKGNYIVVNSNGDEISMNEDVNQEFNWTTVELTDQDAPFDVDMEWYESQLPSKN